MSYRDTSIEVKRKAVAIALLFTCGAVTAFAFMAATDASTTGHGPLIIAMMVFLYSLSLLFVLREAHRQRDLTREQVLADAREMLSDTILNDLAIVSMNAQLSKASPRQRDNMLKALTRIESRIRSLSQTDLQQWFDHYGVEQRAKPIRPAENPGSSD